MWRLTNDVRKLVGGHSALTPLAGLFPNDAEIIDDESDTTFNLYDAMLCCDIFPILSECPILLIASCRQMRVCLSRIPG